MQIGQKYHLYNGYAKTLDDVWINNCELVGVVTWSNGLTQLEFEIPGEEDTMLINYLEMYAWNPSLRSLQVYMYLEAPHWCNRIQNQQLPNQRG
jgi:hypothetical protein